MKKFRILVILSVMAIVGVVYAMWAFAQTDALKNLIISDSKYTSQMMKSSVGDIELDLSELTWMIDDTDGDHVAELMIDGNAVVHFIPSASASENVRKNGVALQCALVMSNGWEYKGAPILEVKTEPILLNNGVASLSAVISKEQLESMVTLKEIYLPTIDDYNEFKSICERIKIDIVVSEAHRSGN